MGYSEMASAILKQRNEELKRKASERPEIRVPQILYYKDKLVAVMHLDARNVNRVVAVNDSFPSVIFGDEIEEAFERQGVRLFHGILLTKFVSNIAFAEFVKDINVDKGNLTQCIPKTEEELIAALNVGCTIDPIFEFVIQSYRADVFQQKILK